MLDSLFYFAAKMIPAVVSSSAKYQQELWKVSEPLEEKIRMIESQIVSLHLKRKKGKQVATAQRGDRACDFEQRESARRGLVIRRNGSPALPASLSSDVRQRKMFSQSRVREHGLHEAVREPAKTAPQSPLDFPPREPSTWSNRLFLDRFSPGPRCLVVCCPPPQPRPHARDVFPSQNFARPAGGFPASACHSRSPRPPRPTP